MTCTRAIAGFLFVLFYLFIFGCSSMQKKDVAVVIEQEIVLDSLPSGSGMVVREDMAWVISDDATGIYALSLTDGTYNKIPFQQYDSSILRIPKPMKPDLESAAMGSINGKDYILAFGSGSIPINRDSALLFDPATKQARFINLGDLYNTLKQKAQLDSGQLNIEAAVITSDHLYLLNRGKNILFSLDWPEFSRHITAPQHQQVPDIKYQKVQLPVANGLYAGFSGACALDKDRILFSASLEDTRDWVADGAVYGSYIGVLNIKEGKVKVEAIAPVMNAAGLTVKDKVESIDVTRRNSDGSIQLVAIVDNDDGTSKLMKLKLSYK
jgi:hypothetical protein